MLVLLYPFPLGITESRYRLFISLSHLDNFVYTSHLWILFIYQSWIFCLYQSYLFSLFIPVFVYIYTSAPVEVSVWLGGITLKSVYDAFCVQDAVQVE